MKIPHAFRTFSNLALGLGACVIFTGVAIADTKPISADADVKRLPATAAQLYRDTTPFPRPMKYQEIPWLLDLDEGIRRAREEHRPVLIWTSGDDPLERC